MNTKAGLKRSRHFTRENTPPKYYITFRWINDCKQTRKDWRIFYKRNNR